MTDSPLFYIDGATEGTTQWRAESMQLVNWGGFHGHHQLAFSAEATLVSGASGTGKSSLLDAYLALMMPSDTPFNGASNDAGSGRARSLDQRNLMTYLRGKTDANRHKDTDELTDQVLRGAHDATWGAVAVTFIDDNQRRFTVLRAYYVPRGAHRFADVTMKMATSEGELDLRELAACAPGRFDKRTLKAQFDGLDVFDTYAAFAQTLYTRLGIGANGEGGKALRLLARIQAGQQVKTVDGLFKAMVLDEPATFTAADKAVDHFEDLERSYGAMVTEAHKAQVLERLPELVHSYDNATSEADLVDTFGVRRTGNTPFVLWQLLTEQRLLDTAADTNREARRTNQSALAAAREAETALKTRIAKLQSQQRDNGGDVLESLAAEQARLGTIAAEVAGERARFDDRVQSLAVAIDSAAAFGVATTRATQFAAEVVEAETTLEHDRSALQRASYPVEERIRVLKQERTFLTGRESLVPFALHSARLLIAEAAGIAVHDLPFVAELIDLAPGEEAWRAAAEVTLGSIVRVVLVDETKLAQLSAAIDPLNLPLRLHFEGVELKPHAEVAGDPAYISGKLTVKDSPFSAWVQARLRSSAIDALCVLQASELGAHGSRVTPSGQTRNGSRGAHGQNANQKPIIGFSSRARLDAIAQELAESSDHADSAAQAASTVAAQLGELREQRAAHQHILDTDWANIDVAAAEARTAEKTLEHERMRTESDILRALSDDEGRVSRELDDAQKRKHAADQAGLLLTEQQGQIVDGQDTVNDRLEQIERGDGVALSTEHSAHLLEQFALVTDQNDLAGFATGVKRLRERLIASSVQHRERAGRDRVSIIAIFQAYQAQWPDPNIGVALESVTSYTDILDAIHTLGLSERRQEWKRRLSAWSGQDLVPLTGAFSSAIEEIEDRLRPINEILATLPFGATRDRLQISLRRLHRDDATAFRAELTVLSSGATEQFTDDETEDRFTRLQKFMSLIRRPDPGTVSQRDLLLDVRQHVEVTAVRVTPEGEEVSTYSSLGGKSGGESQELVAFVVGAALRFQLGDESRTRPRFAPVFLDEGFVKSDAEFAGRAVAAWKGLGFQLIVGAPLDKVTALEPSMQLVLSITKNTATGYSYITPLTTPQVAVA